jgi:hypothetical protein
MADRARNRRNTLERRCLGKSHKRLFNGSPKWMFKMLEAVKKAKDTRAPRAAEAG